MHLGKLPLDKATEMCGGRGEMMIISYFREFHKVFIIPSKGWLKTFRGVIPLSSYHIIEFPKMDVFFLNDFFPWILLKEGPRTREKRSGRPWKRTQNCGGPFFWGFRRSVVERSPWELRHLNFWGPQVWSLFWFREIAENVQRKISGFQVTSKW